MIKAVLLYLFAISIYPSEICTQDSECILVPKSCCTCTEMGENKAIHKSQKDQLEKKRIKECAHSSCLMAISQHWTCTQAEANCIESKCVIKRK